MRLKLFQHKSNYANTVNTVPTTDECLSKTPSVHSGGVLTEPQRGKTSRSQTRTLAHVIQMFDDYQPSSTPASFRSTLGPPSDYRIKANGAVVVNRPGPNKESDDPLRESGKQTLEDDALCYMDSSYSSQSTSSLSTTPSSPVVPTALSPPPRHTYSHHMYSTLIQENHKLRQEVQEGRDKARAYQNNLKDMMTRVANLRQESVCTKLSLIQQRTPHGTLLRRHSAETHQAIHHQESAGSSLLSTAQKIQILLDEIEAMQAEEDALRTHYSHLMQERDVLANRLQDRESYISQLEHHLGAVRLKPNDVTY